METEKILNPLLKAFQEQKLTKANVELMQAQKLVNLYRALECFQPEFADQFNEMLLASSPESRRMMSTIMGGAEVRSYIDFLEQQYHHQSGEENQNLSQLKGYLPSPEMDEKGTPSGTNQISSQEWQEMQDQQKKLMEQTKELMAAVQNNSSNFKKVETPKENVQNYSEIIEDEGGV